MYTQEEIQHFEKVANYHNDPVWAAKVWYNGAWLVFFSAEKDIDRAKVSIEGQAVGVWNSEDFWVDELYQL